MGGTSVDLSTCWFYYRGPLLRRKRLFVLVLTNRSGNGPRFLSETVGRVVKVNNVWVQDLTSCCGE